MSTPEQFRELIRAVTDRIGGEIPGPALQERLNREFGPTSAAYRDIVEACQSAIAAGWMCEREGGGIRYGRVIEPAQDLGGYSVDVVDMDDLAGPHHTHPNGEIDLIMPLAGPARFDGQGAGWLVSGPGSAHRPTVSGGRALVLYLLPQGAIEFTRH